MLTGRAADVGGVRAQTRRADCASRRVPPAQRAQLINELNQLAYVCACVCVCARALDQLMTELRRRPFRTRPSRRTINEPINNNR
jgi:hypothetical protein